VTQDPIQERGTRRWWFAALAAVIVVAIGWAVVASGALNGSTTGGESVSPSPTTSGPPPTPVPTPSLPSPTATGSPTVVPTREPTAVRTGLKESAPAGVGVSASVERIEAVDGEARGPGEIAGPALRVTIRLRNDSDRELRTELGLINLYYGADRTPASTLSGPGAAAFPATIAAGGTGEGTSVFTVPTEARDRIEVEFSYSTDVPVVIFSGSV
jgi:hypothetical protein